MPPIFVNDNILDITVTAGGCRAAGHRRGHPADRLTVVHRVVTATVAADGETVLAGRGPIPTTRPRSWSAARSPRARSQLTIYRVPTTPRWARTLLHRGARNGPASPSRHPRPAPTTQTGLPASDSYPADQELASLTSPPLEAMGTMILETSYNTGANAFLCLLAVNAGSTDCTDRPHDRCYALVEEAGLERRPPVPRRRAGRRPGVDDAAPDEPLVAVGPDQPWGDVFVAGQPVLGETGSLAPYRAGQPGHGQGGGQGRHQRRARPGHRPAVLQGAEPRRAT